MTFLRPSKQCASRPYRLLVLLILLIAGCAKILSLDYHPSHSLQGQGHIDVTSFHYLPSELGEVRPKQVQLNPKAFGSVYLTQDISAFFTDAVKREVVAAGYQLSPDKRRTVTGTIKRFYLDWVDTSEMTFDMTISYAVLSGDQILYENTVACRSSRGKALANDSVVVQEATRQCIVKFLQNAQEAKLF